MRVLPADVYDTLELTAEIFGGIGSGAYATGPDGGRLDQEWLGDEAPLCYVGHLAYAGVIPSVWAIAPFGIDEGANDDAVREVTGGPLFRGPETRIPFEVWCKEMRVVRGE